MSDNLKPAPATAAPSQIVGGPGWAEDVTFNAFWYSHMDGDQMTGYLSHIHYSTAKYIWDAALARAESRAEPEASGTSIYQAMALTALSIREQQNAVDAARSVVADAQGTQAERAQPAGETMDHDQLGKLGRHYENTK